MSMDIHAYVGYARAWEACAYGCIGVWLYGVEFILDIISYAWVH